MTTTQDTPTAEAEARDLRAQLDAEADAQALLRDERDAAQHRYETLADAIVETVGRPRYEREQGVELPEHEALAHWVRTHLDEEPR